MLHAKLYCPWVQATWVQPDALLVGLQAGDALFIPEGWWHQVDSEPTTTAVNFWWQSPFTKSLQQRPHMQQYYLRRLVDGLLDTERSNALASVQPHPRLQAFQAAVDTVASWHSSDQESDMTTSDSTDTSSPLITTPSAAAAAVAAATTPAEQAAHPVSAAAVLSQPSDASQHGHGQYEGSRNAPPATAQARQSGASVLGCLDGCKPGRKRKAASMADGSRSDDAAAIHQTPLQVTPAFQGPMLAPSPAAECQPAACSSARHADSRHPQNIVLPTVDGRSAASSPAQQRVEASRAEADCAGQQEPLHMACMQILAGAVAERLNMPDVQDASTGTPALHVCQQSCGTAPQRCICCIAAAVLLLIGMVQTQPHPLHHCLLMLSVWYRSGRSYHIHFGISATSRSSGGVGNDESMCSTHS